MIRNIKYTFNNTIIRSYDIRGVFNKTLHLKDARIIGNLMGIKVGVNNNINVGYDGRNSSKPLSKSLIKGILETGANVFDIGLVPTPTLYYSCIHNNSQAGIMITGSHNPKEYNGFKILFKNMPLYGDDLKKLEKMALNFQFKQKIGENKKIEIKDHYIENLFRNFKQPNKINIVWDSGNGSSGEIMKSISKRISGKQKLLFSKIDGNFPNHHPDPSDPKNLEFCQTEIKKK